MSLTIEHVENVHIHLGQKSGLPGALLAAIMGSAMPDMAKGTKVPGKDAAGAEPGTSIPPIGAHWLEHKGTYAGISRGLDGKPDAHLIVLDDKPAGKLTWTNAIKWAEGLGNGAHLPTRFESALLYANLQDQFDKESYHWTSTQDSEDYAWCQDFDYGFQDDFYKSAELSARAVRRLPL